MDLAAFEKKVAEASPPLEPELVAKEYGLPGDARKLFEEVRSEEGTVFLDEGTHVLTLENGARLTVYASPYTPALGPWGFQYHAEREGHEFHIEDGTDIVITHGPPKGIMDYTDGRERAGCASLFRAVASARPRVHCFGHFHEGWGAKLVTWRDAAQHGDQPDQPSHFTAIDNDRSPVLEKLSLLVPSRWDTHEEAVRKRQKSERLSRDRCCMTSHCGGDEYPIEPGRQTLFVNASISGLDDLLVQRPWVVDVELPRASTSIG